MSQHMQLDAQDKATLRALDDFTISADDETATIAGEMEVTIVRPAADDKLDFCSRSDFPTEKKRSMCGSRAHSCWNRLA
jgi:hypothetical protein